MKRLILFLNFGCACIAMTAQEMSSHMQQFLTGCASLRNAVEKDNFASLTDAKIALSGVRLVEFSAADYQIDDTNAALMSAPSILFTPEFAAELSKRKTVELGELARSAHLMRGDEYDLKLLHASVKPDSRLTFQTEGIEFCEMALFSMSDSNLKFEVVVPDSENQPVVTAIDNSAYYAGWNLPDEPTVFQFVITNVGTEPQTFVIAIN